MMSGGFDSTSALVEITDNMREIHGSPWWHIEAFLVQDGRRCSRVVCRSDVVAGVFLERSDCCRVNPVRNEVVLGGGYALVVIHSEVCNCDIDGFSGRLLDVAVNGHENVLLSPDLLAVWCSLHEYE